MSAHICAAARAPPDSSAIVVMRGLSVTLIPMSNRFPHPSIMRTWVAT